ncbi:4-(cytidine 5'-diphospho)-2-C-methyl-D-erythritol kinase [Candidatus Poribacteria bacterium]|nr:4-(cytidine 5'-diphospho)-2-C-methyl-D-erythritol kinase [Candidatus Poribacteria bacterium]
MSKRVVIKSFAKINLYLDVICKRRDGYHNIETIFQTVNLADIIEMELTSSAVEITCDSPLVPTDKNNLVFKAFLGLKRTVRYHGGVKIWLRKRIPPESGMGGGSSNAAAVIIGLNHLMRTKLSDDTMRKIATPIGADVPFFISGGLAAAWRIGDKLKPLPLLPRSHIVIAIPRDVAVSTAVAYRMLTAPACRRPAPGNLSQCSDGLKACVKALGAHEPLSRNSALLSLLHNSLEEPVFAGSPVVGKLKKSLLKAGARGALMSGSGSAVFGLADSLSHAREIKKALDGFHDCASFVTSTTDSGSVMAESV